MGTIMRVKYPGWLCTYWTQSRKSSSSVISLGTNYSFVLVFTVVSDKDFLILFILPCMRYYIRLSLISFFSVTFQRPKFSILSLTSTSCPQVLLLLEWLEALCLVTVSLATRWTLHPEWSPMEKVKAIVVVPVPLVAAREGKDRGGIGVN